MAKVRRVPQAFQDTKGIPGQYTTDPNVASPEQIAALGDVIDKAQKLRGGAVLNESLAEQNPLLTNLVAPGTAETNAPGSVRRSRNQRVRGSGSLKTTMSFHNLVQGNVGVSIEPTIGLQADDLPEQYKVALQMLQTKTRLQAQDPDQSEEFVRFREMLSRRNDMESEQSRLRSMFRRFDNLYHPTTITIGGADHWPDDPNARLAGRAHISVNVHPSYVNIPAALQAVRPVINYVPNTPDREGRQLASDRERLFFRWWEENDFDLLLEDACTLKSLYGHTAAKVYWDSISQLPRVSIVESPENLYLGFGSSDFRRIDWALYVYGLSPQATMEEFGVETIPVTGQQKTWMYTSATTHDDPLATIYRNNLEKNPARNRSQYELNQVEVYDYWYKKPTNPGEAPMVYNAIFVGNTMVKNEAHPEYLGLIPYLPLVNSKIPGSPYGKPELYDVEQLLREKDERISAQAQMIASTVGGQMWQLVGSEAPDEVPPNAIPKPNRIATPGPGNEIRTITPFIPEFQVEDYNRRIDREIAVVTGLNDLLLGLAPTSVLGSSRAIASLVANYEARLQPKRKLLYSWLKQVWEMTGRLWSEKDADVEFILGGEYRIDIVPPELTPRDTLELAQTAINLVQNRIWSADRAMDRVGVEDPLGEKDTIREEQTDVTLNPSAVMAMGNLIGIFRQLGLQLPTDGQQAANQAQAAAMMNNPQPNGMEAMNSPEQLANPPAEMMPQNAPLPGVDMASPQQAPQEANQ
jgi:hypothetical protein